GNWYHIAYVKEDKTLTLYVNGAIDSSVQLAGRTVGNTGPIYIGKDPWYQSVEGRYDDYVIYTRALSAEEVKGMAGNVEKPSHMPLSAPEAAPQF
ncbi:MAG TPA: LamG domain-containing protein, partial [Planctomycetota bacterium]|nr:LamG domain-containing protein [Planctomycetota bacterium]